MVTEHYNTFRAPWIVVLSFLCMLAALGIALDYKLAKDNDDKIGVLQKEKANKSDADRAYDAFDRRFDKIEKNQEDMKNFLIDKLGPPGRGRYPLTISPENR